MTPGCQTRESVNELAWQRGSWTLSTRVFGDAVPVQKDQEYLSTRPWFCNRPLRPTMGYSWPDPVKLVMDLLLAQYVTANSDTWLVSHRMILPTRLSVRDDPGCRKPMGRPRKSRLGQTDPTCHEELEMRRVPTWKLATRDPRSWKQSVDSDTRQWWDWWWYKKYTQTPIYLYLSTYTHQTHTHTYPHVCVCVCVSLCSDIILNLRSFKSHPYQFILI